MSTRYGVSLTLEPAVTAQLHRARQVICSQYGCWAAEMHSVHLPLFSYFACSEATAPSLNEGLSVVASDFRAHALGAYLSREGIAVEEEGLGSIFLEFAPTSSSIPGAAGDLPVATTEDAPAQHDSLGQLIYDVGQLLQRQGIHLEPEPTPRFGLLQHAGLPPHVLRSAHRLAGGLITGLELPAHSLLWELVLIRFQSDAAEAQANGPGWQGGGWANDLRWQFIGCHPLNARAK